MLLPSEVDFCLHLHRRQSCIINFITIIKLHTDRIIDIFTENHVFTRKKNFVVCLLTEEPIVLILRITTKFGGKQLRAYKSQEKIFKNTLELGL